MYLIIKNILEKKENLLLEFHNENKFWDIENNNIGFGMIVLQKHINFQIYILWIE